MINVIEKDCEYTKANPSRQFYIKTDHVRQRHNLFDPCGTPIDGLYGINVATFETHKHCESSQSKVKVPVPSLDGCCPQNCDYKHTTHYTLHKPSCKPSWPPYPPSGPGAPISKRCLKTEYGFSLNPCSANLSLFSPKACNQSPESNRDAASVFTKPPRPRIRSNRSSGHAFGKQCQPITDQSPSTISSISPKTCNPSPESIRYQAPVFAESQAKKSQLRVRSNRYLAPAFGKSHAKQCQSRIDPSSTAISSFFPKTCNQSLESNRYLPPAFAKSQTKQCQPRISKFSFGIQSQPNIEHSSVAVQCSSKVKTCEDIDNLVKDNDSTWKHLSLWLNLGHIFFLWATKFIILIALYCAIFVILMVGVCISCMALKTLVAANVFLIFLKLCDLNFNQYVTHKCN